MSSAYKSVNLSCMEYLTILNFDKFPTLQKIETNTDANN